MGKPGSSSQRRRRRNPGKTIRERNNQEIEIDFISARKKYFWLWILFGLLGGFGTLLLYSERVTNLAEVLPWVIVFLGGSLPLLDWRYRLKYEADRTIYIELFLTGVVVTFIFILAGGGLCMLAYIVAGGAIN